MKKEWTAKKDGDQMIYSLEVSAMIGEITVRTVASQNPSELWAVFHQGVQLVSYSNGLNAALDFANELVDRLTVK